MFTQQRGEGGEYEHCCCVTRRICLVTHTPNIAELTASAAGNLVTHGQRVTPSTQTFHQCYVSAFLETPLIGRVLFFSTNIKCNIRENDFFMIYIFYTYRKRYLTLPNLACIEITHRFQRTLPLCQIRYCHFLGYPP